MGDVASDFPLFPLPLVALPTEQVPLHIFEERYKTMIGRCLEDGAEFGIVWFRRDLRVHDHPALARAAAEYDRVIPLFVLDPALARLSEARIAFMHGCLRALDAELRERGAGLVVREGRPADILARTNADAVLCTSDVSPYALRRDGAIDGLIRCPGSYVTDIGKIKPYVVFSAFHRAWLDAPRRDVLDAPDELRGALKPTGVPPGPKAPFALPEAGERAAWERAGAWLDDGIAAYADDHDRMSGGTSALSPHLRWGTISARALEQRVAQLRSEGAREFRRQLCWRDFFAQVMLRGHGFARAGVRWTASAERLDAWREGRTGYPLVDAGMRQLARTGWMHNRARLVTASFLVYDLHVDWRLGEEHFFRLLLDGEPAQNNGNWQWVAAGEPRRLLNPTRQAQRFDRDGAYVRRWVEELRDVEDADILDPPPLVREETGYPHPIVDHAEERSVAFKRLRRV